MMRGKKTALAATALVVAAFSASGGAQAAGEHKGYWLDVEGGIEFDDNVAVDQTDATKRVGDTAATFELDSGYKLVDSGNSRVEIGYDFFQSVYQDVTEFNYQSHSPMLNAWTKFDNFKVGASYTYTHALLGNYFFFDEHELMPSLTYYFSDSTYLTGYVRYRNRNYDRARDDARDGNSWQPGADLYVYFDKENRGFFSVGGGYATEDTKGSGRAYGTTVLGLPADEFDYAGFSGRASVQVPIELFGLPGRTKLSYAYQKRDYDNPNPFTPGNVARMDDRNTVRGLVELRVTDDLKAGAEYRWVNRNSNLATSDYNENIGSFTLRYAF